MQVFITGAAGRLGQLLCAAWADCPPWGFEPIWSSRCAGPRQDLVWDILSGPSPDITKGAVILHLAGVLRGDRAALSANAAMARNVCTVAKAAGASHVFLASSAAIYGAAMRDHVEEQAPAPLSDYGHSKLDMERETLCWAHSLGPDAPGVTCLRIGNVLGADALFGGVNPSQHIVLDPVPGQPGGPIRSYIGPQALAQVLAGLVARVGAGTNLPKILNIAAPGTLSMADLLDAAQIPYSFGKPNVDAIPKVSLSTKRLAALIPLCQTNAAAMVADWRGLMAAAA
jgi:nucleoside-diphosphate-sugar epimerase